MIREMFKGDVTIHYVPVQVKEHYEITPYTFNPRLATKISNNEYVDMGQGILQVLAEIHQRYVVAAKDKDKYAEVNYSA